METIKQEIILDDSQYGEAVKRIVSGLNEVGNVAEETGANQRAALEEVSKAFSDAQKEVVKTIDVNAKLGEQNKKTTESERKKASILSRLADLYRGPYQQSIRNAIKTLDQWRTVLQSAKAELDKSSESAKAATKPTTILGEVWQSLTTSLATRFPKAAQAVAAGLRFIKTAIVATGIGALVVAIGLIINGLVSLSSNLKTANRELSNTERASIAFESALTTARGIVTNFVQNIKDAINGTKTFGEAMRASGKDIAQFATTVGIASVELAKAKQATKDAETAFFVLAEAVSQSKDELNKQREIAADSNRTIGQRVTALKQAAEIESSLEAQRLKALELNKQAAVARLALAKETGAGIKEAENALIESTQALRSAQAEANARQRADQAAINNLYREGAQQLAQFRKEYADLLQDLNQRLQDAKLEELVGVDRIKAELKLAIDAINDLEVQVREAAKKARQEFDAKPFAELRLLAEKKAAQEIKKFESEEALKRIEAERQRQSLLGQTLSESFDERLNLEEAQAAFILAAERKAFEDRLAVQRKFYADSGQLQTDAAREELAQLELNIELTKRKEAELLQKAKERLAKERLEDVQLEAEISELQLQLIRRSGDKTLTLEQFIEQERLKIQAAAIEKRIKILTEAYGPDNPEIRLLTAQLANIKATIERGAGDTGDAVSNFIKKTFGINDEGLAFVTSQFSGAFSRITAAAETFTQAAIEQSRRRLDALNKEIDQTKELLEEELKAKEAGYANNYTLYKNQLEKLTAEREKVEAETLEKQKRAANAQLAINTAMQASEYILAAVRFFSTGASLGPIVGVALALGAIGILASTIAQAKANAEQFAAVPKFHEGGPVEGALHGYGGKRIEVEGGEFVVRSQVAQRHKDFLQDLNDGRFQEIDFTKLLQSRLTLQPILEKMEKDREIIVNFSQRIDYNLFERMYERALYSATNSIISYLQTRPVEKLDENGEVVIEWKEGNTLRRQRVRRLRE